MYKSFFSPLLRILVAFLTILSGLLLTYSVPFAQQVVISPEKIKSPTFHTNTATCYGANANTHINLGFGSSVTGSNTFQENEYCTVGGGYNNQASGNVSTVGGGKYNQASGYASTVGGGWDNQASGYYSTVVGGWGNKASVRASTVGGGEFNIAGGWYSWAGGCYMQLTETANHTFVWGHSAITPQSISIADAFLIFPAGTPGRVGIGTKSPEQIMHIVGVSPRILVEGSSGNPEINFKNSGDPNSVIWALYKHTNTHDFRFWQNGDRLTIQNATGNIGIGTTSPLYKLHVNGDAAGTSWTNLSSREFKEHIQKVDKTAHPLMLARLMDMDLTTYKYKKEYGGDGDTKLGFIAEDMPEEVLSKDGKGVDLYELLALTIGAIKGQQREVDELKTENDALRQEIQQIKALLGM